MKLKLFIILFILLYSSMSSAANEIRLNSAPLTSIVEVSIDCNTIDLSTAKVFLVRKIPPGGDYNYTSAIYFYDNTGKAKFFLCRKDILNQYVFIPFIDNFVPQFYGWDFVFNIWEDTAFYNVFKVKTCADLKQYHFIYGIYLSPDLSDFEGAAFTFK